MTTFKLPSSLLHLQADNNTLILYSLISLMDNKTQQATATIIAPALLLNSSFPAAFASGGSRQKEGRKKKRIQSFFLNGENDLVLLQWNFGYCFGGNDVFYSLSWIYFDKKHLINWGVFHYQVHHYFYFLKFSIEALFSCLGENHNSQVYIYRKRII